MELPLIRKRRHAWRVLGFCLCLGMPSLAPAQVENSPGRDNPAQADWLRKQARQAQEEHRLRVALPRAAWVRPGEEPPNTASQGVTIPAAPPASGDVPGRDLLLIAAACFGSWFGARKILKPKTAECNSGYSGPPTVLERPVSAGELAEEQALRQFAAALQAGSLPKAACRTSPTEQAVGKPIDKPAQQGEDGDSLDLFLTHAREQSLGMRILLQSIPRATAEGAQQQRLTELRDQLLALKNNASGPNLLPVWQVATGVGCLVGQFVEQKRTLTAHHLQTIAGGLDLLVDLCHANLEPTLCTEPPIRILAVDDDLLSRHALAFSLKKAYNQPDVAANPEAALAQACLIPYDVIFLDIRMPKMDGFELCAKIRQTSVNRDTPVVFVTCEDDLQARAQSNLSGGTDLIAKPFLTFEITVKALVLALRGRLTKLHTGQCQLVPPDSCCRYLAV